MAVLPHEELIPIAAGAGGLMDLPFLLQRVHVHVRRVPPPPPSSDHRQHSTYPLLVAPSSSSVFFGFVLPPPVVSSLPSTCSSQSEVGAAVEH
ncbi:hypothetical protein H0H93_015917 [Arthromyces matolae]|nr:hypothetical protein H0H93_015917 [Arthromyces matolae]